MKPKYCKTCNEETEHFIEVISRRGFKREYYNCSECGESTATDREKRRLMLEDKRFKQLLNRV